MAKVRLFLRLTRCLRGWIQTISICCFCISRSVTHLAHGKPAVQVVLRFEMQEGFITIPGSFNPDHIAENFHSQDFDLTEEEMNEIRALNKDKRFFVAFEDFTYEQAENMILNMHS